MNVIPIAQDDIHEHKAAQYLSIGGLTKLTTIDFPGCLSAVVFVRGCPWRCLYCQNKDLQSREVPEEEIETTWEELDKFLNKRKGLLDGVVFSGGEPLTDPALFNALLEVKKKGFKIGLHTGGIYPRKLAEILPFLDWIGLDIKAPLSNCELYQRVTGRRDSANVAMKSLEMILDAGVSLEVRTTAHPSYLTENDIEDLATDLSKKGVDNYALQIYRQPPQSRQEDLLERVGSDYPLEKTIAKLEKLFKTFVLRR